jgi:hypothetical protein
MYVRELPFPAYLFPERFLTLWNCEPKGIGDPSKKFARGLPHEHRKRGNLFAIPLKNLKVKSKSKK